LNRVDHLNREEALDIIHSPSPNEILEFYNEPYPITSAQQQFYATNGYIKLEKLLNGFALNYAREVISAAVLIRKEHDRRKLVEKSQYDQSFLQCGYLCWDFPAVKDYVFAKRFSGIAKSLLEINSGIRLWHDQALFKEPRGRFTDIHIDSSYWPLSEPGKSTTLWMALTNVPKERGSLYFFQGSHLWNRHDYIDIFSKPHLPDELAGKEKVFVELKAGDATFHSGLTYHGVGPNEINEMRKAMTIIYIKDGMRFDASDERNATHTSCDGLNDGQIIDTKYTPLLI